jgi:hypothetical protein
MIPSLSYLMMLSRISSKSITEPPGNAIVTLLVAFLFIGSLLRQEMEVEWATFAYPVQ